MIYIASPYSHPQDFIRDARFVSALRYTQSVLLRGIVAFSPIVYGHPFAKHLGAPTNHEAWEFLNRQMIIMADEIHVLMMDGWRESKGIAAEIEFAKQTSTPVVYVSWS